MDSVAAEGAILAHSVKLADKTLKKGRQLGAADVAALLAANIANVTVARLDADDVHEDAAAEQLGAALLGVAVSAKAPFTGRVNLYAEVDGILHFDADAVARVNQVDEVITLATLAPWAVVKRRQMIATIKIIPFAVPNACLEAALNGAQAAQLACRDAHEPQAQAPV